MDYDDVIRDAAVALAKSDGLDFDEVCGVDANPDEGYCDSGTCIAAHWEEHDAEQARRWYLHLSRAAAPILMEYGARLMRDAVLPDVQTDRTIENHGAHCRCTTCELNITEDSIRTLDPADIVKEAVK